MSTYLQPLIRKHLYLIFAPSLSYRVWCPSHEFGPRIHALGWIWKSISRRQWCQDEFLLICFGIKFVRQGSTFWQYLIVIKWRWAWSILHTKVILPYILNTIRCMNVIGLDNVSVKLNQSELHFIVQWVCLVIEFFWCMRALDNELVLPSPWLLTVTCISWPSVFALYPEYFLMYDVCCYNESVWAAA